MAGLRRPGGVAGAAALRPPAGMALLPPPPVRTTPARPLAPAVPRAQPTTRAQRRSACFEPLMNRRDRCAFIAIVGLWLLANYNFWTWWLEGSRGVGLAGYMLNTLLISFDLIEPAWFFYFIWRTRRPISRGVARRFRVAAGTTKTPSEPLEVVGETLLAIKAMEGEHDTWLLDEGDDRQVRAWCALHGINYFTRKGIEKYQQDRWPFQRRMKAGNYNAWLDAVGYANYDIFCQFDSDHRPRPDYLQNARIPFERDEVAYVAAPSICHGNRDASWVVLGRAEMETILHGPLNAGANDGYAPLIIGSHCAFRLAALREIGGFQTTWCEDHDNTLAFNAMGYEGVFQIDAIAVGDGPTSFAEAMQQEYQWARGLMQILLNSTPVWFGNLPLGKKLQLLFSETWYTRVGLTKLGCILLPGLALVTDSSLANVSYFGFLWREGLVILSFVVAQHFLWARGWTRPREIRPLSWRTILFQSARWPWPLLGCGEAILGKILGKDFAIRVTAKGKAGPRPLPIKVLWPYIAIVLFAVAVAELFRYYSPHASGYGSIALVTAGWYGFLVVAVVALQLRENAIERSWTVAWLHNGRPLVAAAAVLVVTVFGIGGQVQPTPIGDILLPWIEPPMVLASAGHQTAEEAAVLPSAGQHTPEETAVLGVSASRPGETEPVPSAPDRGGRTATWARSAFQVGQAVLGAYDPDGQLADYELGAEVLFHFWRRAGADQLGDEIDRVLAAGRLPIVTIEPRPYGIAAVTGPTLLEDIAAGHYDGTVRAYAQAVRARQPHTVVLRFAPEMELFGAHAWSQGKPRAYVRAYRHVVNLFHAEDAANVVVMWSPAGASGADAYYPGDAYVDVIGITILASEEWDREAGFKQTRSLHELLSEKYMWAERYNKPLVIAEAGVAVSDPREAERWLSEVPAVFQEFPLLRGFFYFNARQPLAPNITVRPDWRLQRPNLLFPVRGTDQAQAALRATAVADS